MVDAQMGSLYQWRQADQPPPLPLASSEQRQKQQGEQIQFEGEPRVHIGSTVMGLTEVVDTEASKLAVTPRQYAANRHSRMRRGASWD